jgi:hypothetical protein
MNDLEDLLREVISQGQPRTHRPWNKIFVIVEGLYSMEGNTASLPDIVLLKKKYKVHSSLCPFLSQSRYSFIYICSSIYSLMRHILLGP